jgi:hypothetical protein
MKYAGLVGLEENANQASQYLYPIPSEDVLEVMPNHHLPGQLVLDAVHFGGIGTNSRRIAILPTSAFGAELTTILLRSSCSYRRCRSLCQRQPLSGAELLGSREVRQCRGEMHEPSVLLG